jgi:hypothetical protein
MLVLNSSERWRVDKWRFSTFVCESFLFSYVSPPILQPQLRQHYQLKICDLFIETEAQWRIWK